MKISFKAVEAFRKKADDADFPVPAEEKAPAGPEPWGDTYVNPAIRSVLNEGGPGAEIASNILHAMQDLEEIWGFGDNVEGYLKFMEALKAEIDERISNAQSLSAGGVEEGPSADLNALDANV